MNEELRWGILATGGIARAFATDLSMHGFTIHAVGSRSARAADSFAADFGIPNAYGSYEELVADPQVDIVYVATPNSCHAANAKLALQAGKHVLIEKPMTINAREAREIVALAADSNLLVMEAMWTRFLPHMVRIHEILNEGTLGDVSSFIADHTQVLASNPEHRINALELGGGALLDLGVYPISFASQMFGTPATIHALASFKDTGVDAQVAVQLEYPGGRIASLFAASTVCGPNTATILGTDGRIEIDSVWYMPTSFTVYNNDNRATEAFESEVIGRGMQFEAMEAEQLIRDGRIASKILAPEESIEIMRTMDAVRQSIGLRFPMD